MRSPDCYLGIYVSVRFVPPSARHKAASQSVRATLRGLLRCPCSSLGDMQHLMGGRGADSRKRPLRELCQVLVSPGVR